MHASIARQRYDAEAFRALYLLHDNGGRFCDTSLDCPGIDEVVGVSDKKSILVFEKRFGELERGEGTLFLSLPDVLNGAPHVLRPARFHNLLSKVADHQNQFSDCFRERCDEVLK